MASIDASAHADASWPRPSREENHVDKATPAIPNPILFVTQFPITTDFGAIGSVFANHRGDIQYSGRGGDLYIVYPDGVLRNLTEEAHYGLPAGLQAGSDAIAVRDPAVHWSGTKAVFSMVTGAPEEMYGASVYYWQLYEVTGLGEGDAAVITKVPNQPESYNNVQPAYDSDGNIVFVTDRVRHTKTMAPGDLASTADRYLYPQLDEYESAPTPTGLWKLDPATGELSLMEHAVSGSGWPFVDSYGRVVFSRWDHLLRDQQNDADATVDYGTFNYSGEGPESVPTSDRSEVFPEPRYIAPPNTTGCQPLAFNLFGPWQIMQDGTGEETINHIGRHELQNYFDRTFNDDPALSEFFFDPLQRTNQHPIRNMIQLREDPTQRGTYLAVDAPEFGSHAAGQIIRFAAPLGMNAADIAVDWLTSTATAGFDTSDPANSGHYRNPIVLSDGRILAAHAPEKGLDGNLGSPTHPDPKYKFRLRLMTGPVGSMTAGDPLLPSPVTKHVSYYDPDALVQYDGPMWELSPVEVVARDVPPKPVAPLGVPEQDAFELEHADVAEFTAFLKQHDLAAIVMRNVTSRDGADRQQPYNLHVAVPGGITTLGSGGAVYDIAHMQFFQADQIRGMGIDRPDGPAPGRRVLAEPLHEPAAVAFNPHDPEGPAGAVPIHADGSVALYVPARRALAWQSTDPAGTPVVRERYWITMQPGEIRVCDGCHGVNKLNQAGQPAASNVADALRTLIRDWKAGGVIFKDGFEH
ncbi:MAG TPA: hypothetical protein VJ696_01930 [Rhodanobacteraceae bacterium]|nr:hypothetical protein [Rhodanobacteraceae bacterium]